MDTVLADYKWDTVNILGVQFVNYTQILVKLIILSLSVTLGRNYKCM